MVPRSLQKLGSDSPLVPIIYIAQLYAYAYFEYACACSKHVYTSTP